MEDKLIKIVVIGGGHGTGIVLSSLAGIDGLELTAIVSMADDGGSTGRLRTELGVSAVGDIRQCLIKSSTDHKLAELFDHRFEGGKLDGHSLGNLFLASGELRTGSIEESIEIARQALGGEATILPVTDDRPYLCMNSKDKTEKGVYKIANLDFDGRKADFYLEPDARLSEAAETAIRKADFILLAPGNFYCSIIPALITKGLADAVNASDAKTVLISNLLNRKSQTSGFTIDDYVTEINRLTGGLDLDYVLFNDKAPGQDCLREGETPVGIGLNVNDFRLIVRDIADDEKVLPKNGDKIAAVRSLARHDGTKLAAAIDEIIQEGLHE